MQSDYTLTMYEEDLGFPRKTLEKYIRDPQAARDAIMYGGRPFLTEEIIKNWACHYFRRDMKVPRTTNNFGFDIISDDGEIFIEVKSSWKPDSKYVSFKSIGQKKDAKGEYAFTHIAFYSPLLDPNGVVLFSRKQFEEQVVLPPAGKLNIKMDLNEGYSNNTCHKSSVAFYNNIKWM
jgi:hypothetical protein